MDYATYFQTALNALDEISNVSLFNVKTDTVQTSEGVYKIYVDVPGVAVEDINIESKGNQIIICGENKEVIPMSEDDILLQQGRSLGTFKKVIKIPFYVNSDDVVTSYKNGLLKITAPPPSKLKYGKVEISID